MAEIPKNRIISVGEDQRREDIWVKSGLVFTIGTATSPEPGNNGRFK
jgi:hypothetical protein